MKAYHKHRKGMYLHWLFAVFRGKLKASAAETAKTIHRLGTVKSALGER
jgi:hypothetical protein